jgi:outer membrane protein OmpA-like peptidoglycan-associated protein
VLRSTILALSCAFGAATAAAIGYMPDIEEAQWQLERGPLECRLVQPLPFFGSAEFLHPAGETVRFTLTSSHPIAAGTAEVRVDSPPWRHDAAPGVLSAVPVFASRQPVLLDSALSEQLLVALYNGNMPVLAGMPWQAGDSYVDVALSAVNFQRAYHDYRDCVTALVPATFDDVERSRILFEPNQWALGPADRDRLDLIIRYVKADRFVDQIYVDGYTDESGSPALNRELSKRRAETVTRYLTARGIDEARITTRHHGERFAEQGDVTPEERAEGRRVTIRLERV